MNNLTFLRYSTLAFILSAFILVGAFAQNSKLGPPSIDYNHPDASKNTGNVIPKSGEQVNCGQSSSGNLTVAPFSGDMRTLPMGQVNTQVREVPYGEVPDPALLERIRNTTLPVGDGKNIQQVSPPGSPNSTISDYNFAGPTQNGWVPADNNIAAGSGYIVAVTNEQMHVYNQSTLALIGTNTLQNIFNSSADTIGNVFDPKVFYDGWVGRFVILALGATNTRAIYYVFISQTSNPWGSYWYYKFRGDFNGGGGTNGCWSDYPGLAFGDGDITHGAVYITTNQMQRGGPFQYDKIRILQKNQIYNGTNAGWYDFWGMTDANSDLTYALKPANTWWGGFGGPSSEYLFNSKWYGSNVVTLWRIDNPISSPTLNRQATITVLGYSPPPNAPQLGGSGTLASAQIGCVTSDVIYSNGGLFTCINSSYNFGSGNNAIAQYDLINVGSNTLTHEIRFGSNGYWFMYPCPVPQYKAPFGNDSVGIVFSISGSSIYGTSGVIGYDGSGLTNTAYRNGTGYLGNGNPSRWGDYHGVAVNPAQNGEMYGFSMLANSGSWGSGIHIFAFHNLTGIQNLGTEIPKTYSLKQNYPNPFNPTTDIDFSVPKSGVVKLVVYDVLGNEVSTVVNKSMEAGTYQVTFDASSIASGVYFYKLIAGDFISTKKMVLIK
jgi:Secretion system C-terminal sorting domain